MKKNKQTFKQNFIGFFTWQSEIRIRPMLISLAAFFICAVFILSGGFGILNNQNAELREFEVGKVAERDIVADRNVSYIDENAELQDITRGDRIIRRGFIISSEDMAQLNALNISESHRSPRNSIGQFFILFFVFVLFFFLLNPKVIGRKLEEREIYFIAILASAYLIGSVLIHSFLPADSILYAVLVPTAFVIMLPALLIGQASAFVMAIIFPLSAFVSGAFDTSAYIFAVISGFSAAFILQTAERRMDLIKAGFINAAVNIAAMAAILLYTQSINANVVPILFWAAFNGIFSGMLVLGILPLFEQVLNSATTFRLIELSDLNSPILKRLLTVAPGTYSHAVMVANLAESACQEIGANALLARVGAYYHDIGKMEQPEYFTENQSGYNKHTSINPRLSATVIRSHVKIGVEKGRSIGLPPAVIDIIAQHHGNSVIAWFYSEAQKKEGQVNIEDFTYPGTPPHSREAAVVMLADVVEAAVRSLKKPTAAKIEKFIQELIKGKFDMGQLNESDLTFRNLETIKNAFVKVLAGHYHTRIEYPKQKEAANE